VVPARPVRLPLAVPGQEDDADAEH